MQLGQLDRQKGSFRDYMGQLARRHRPLAGIRQGLRGVQNARATKAKCGAAEHGAKVKLTTHSLVFSSSHIS